MVINNSTTNNSNLLTNIRLIIWIPLIIGVLLLILLFLCNFGCIEISSLFSFSMEYVPFFTLLATLVLVSITAYYAYATKKIADSTEKNVVIAKNTTDTMKKTMEYQAILEIQKDYRSSEMTSAINELWNFYRKCEKDYKKIKPKIDLETYLKIEYKKHFRSERKKISNKEMTIEEGLNYKRRLVTHFYIHLATIYEHKILPERMIFDWWMPSDIKIIDKFIIPLQYAMGEQFRIPKKEIKFALRFLPKLRDGSKSYFKKNIVK